MGSEEDSWGAGNKAEDKPFDRQSFQSGEEFDLIFGEHPHSRQDNNVYARLKGGSVVGFDGHRPRVDFEFRSYNYLKSSYYSGDQIRAGGNAVLKFNDKPVYSFFYRDPIRALDRMQEITHKLLEHPVPLWRQDGTEKLEGRKVYYRDTPATIVSYDGEQGCVLLKAEEGKTFPRPAWADDEDYSWDEEDRVVIKDDILSPHIWWFRSDKKQKDQSPDMCKDGTMTAPAPGEAGALYPGKVNAVRGKKCRRKRSGPMPDSFRMAMERATGFEHEDKEEEPEPSV